ncbi:MAG: DNA polymerase III subunit delta [Legionellales bacterium]|nr:DNA polymerase III subunit delta [Legionellales bacterium]
MKIKCEELTSTLTRTLSPVYCITGDEIFFVEQTLEQLRGAASAQGFSEREVFFIDAHFNWSHLENSVAHASLFNPRSLIEIRMPNNKPGTAGADFLKNYALHPNPNKIIVIVLSKLDSATSRSAWIKQLEKHGVIIQIWPLTPKQWPYFIANQTQHYQLNIAAAGLEKLAYTFEGNLLALDQCLQHLKLLYSQQTITLPMLNTIIQHQAQFDIFALSDAAIAGEVERVIHIMETLQQLQVEPILCLWALTQDIRKCVTLHQHSAAEFTRLCTQLSLWPQRRPYFQAALRRHNLASCLALLSECARIDQLCKGMLQENVWIALTDVSLRLAGKKLWVNHA